MSLLFRLIIALAVLGMCLAANLLQTRSTPLADQTLILTQHNNHRKGVSPTATDMRKMYWDDDLERAAQEWVDQCIWGHDNGYARRQSADIGAQVGQNMAKGSSWTGAIQMWYDEVNYYDYNTNSATETGQAIGHYTQVVWSESSLVGCAMATCPKTDGSGDINHYACNYAYGNMQGQKIYQNGTSCDACPDQCVEDKLCDCPDGKICKNGGELNLNTCTCTCKYGFSGDSCGICPWEDLDNGCYNWFPQSKCSEWANVPEACPVMCGFCPDNCPGMNMRSCQNGGTLQQDCTCECHPNFSGATCDTVINCADASYCNGPRPDSYPVEYCTKWSNVPIACPLMCGLCTV